MRITVFGGANEIGGNQILLETEKARVLLDFGRRMGETGKLFEEFIILRNRSILLDMLKLELVPKIDGLYPAHLLDITSIVDGDNVLLDKCHFHNAPDYWTNTEVKPYGGDCKVDAVFVSHAHFDHIGGLNELDYPFYLHPDDARFLENG
ncbi:MAG TPA: MBL fold metallo-hydrolase, partial [Euryarchaeota archaeon]|nr:MBL fold metallo-hydrolase [Euryarchaeota archaeon]